LILHIINYSVRGIILLIGVLLVSGVMFPDYNDSGLYRVMGFVFILFGLYRLILYYTQQKRLKRENDNESDS
jgi:hypothetical protein